MNDDDSRGTVALTKLSPVNMAVGAFGAFAIAIAMVWYIASSWSLYAPEIPRPLGVTIHLLFALAYPAIGGGLLGLDRIAGRLPCFLSCLLFALQGLLIAVGGAAVTAHIALSQLYSLVGVAAFGLSAVVLFQARRRWGGLALAAAAGLVCGGVLHLLWAAVLHYTPAGFTEAAPLLQVVVAAVWHGVSIGFAIGLVLTGLCFVGAPDHS